MSRSSSFVGVIGDPRAYLGIVYGVVRLPIAFAYLMLLGIGLPAAIGLLPVGVGFGVLLLVLLCTWGCAVFERELGRWWFGFELRPMAPAVHHPRTWWQRMRDFGFNPVTWKSLLYVFLQVPIGVLYFAVVIGLVTLSTALIGAPLIFLLDAATARPGDPAANVLGLTDPSSILLATTALGVTGILLGIATLHVARAIALGHGS
ncbi:MAG: sensor domain-containing protein, partial [Chloroflexota bacterium]